MVGSSLVSFLGSLNRSVFVYIFQARVVLVSVCAFACVLEFVTFVYWLSL